MPTTNVQIPALGESVTEATLIKWHKNDGDVVKTDEPICELETDKANADLPSPGSGVIKRLKGEGEKVRIGETIATLDPAGANPKPATAAPAEKTSRVAKTPAPPTAPAPWAPPSGVPSSGPAVFDPEAQTRREAGPAATSVAEAPPENEDRLSPAVRRMVEENQLDPSQIRGTGPNGRIIKEDVQRFLLENRRQRERRATDAETGEAAAVVAPPAPSTASGEAGTRRAPMSKIRKRIAENLVRAQQTAAILTTFNEIDLSNIIDIRSKYKERFEKVHGVGLGFMSFFARAVVLALKEFERVNAFLEGDDIVYHDYVNLGIAVSTDRGLAVPVLRHAEQMSFAKLESEIKRLAAATRDGKLSVQELSGGTFTITNGGIFGSLLSTPILNPPQSGILGMHAIQKRPVAIADKIEIRPMMYVALSYDHRLVDGRESVSFLVRVKELLEDPARLMLEI